MGLSMSYFFIQRDIKNQGEFTFVSFQPSMRNPVRCTDTKGTWLDSSMLILMAAAHWDHSRCSAILLVRGVFSKNV